MIGKGNAREGFEGTFNFSCDVSKYYNFSSKMRNPITLIKTKTCLFLHIEASELLTVQS